MRGLGASLVRAPSRAWVAIACAAFVALAGFQAHALGVTSGPDSRAMRGLGLIGDSGWSLACLFSTDTGSTCSDSRVVTTTRSTAVPCQQSDGTWGTAAINTACIAPGGVAGVEAYGAVTNYWNNSATPASWGVNGGTVDWADVGGGWWRATDTSASVPSRTGTRGPAAAGTYTAHCRVRAGSVSSARIRWFVSGGTGTTPTACATETITSDAAGQALVCTRNASDLTGAGAITAIVEWGLDQAGSATGGTFDFQNCALEFASTPGRRCDSGGTATTCAKDQPEVSTTGWPVAAGEIEVEYRPSVTTDTATRVLVDARSTGGYMLYWDAGSLKFAVQGGATHAAAVALASSQRFRVVWGGGSVRLYAGGSLIGSVAGAAMPSTPLLALAQIGLSGSTGLSPANGTISILYIGEPR